MVFAFLFLLFLIVFVILLKVSLRRLFFDCQRVQFDILEEKKEEVSFFEDVGPTVILYRLWFPSFMQCEVGWLNRAHLNTHTLIFILFSQLIAPLGILLILNKKIVGPNIDYKFFTRCYERILQSKRITKHIFTNLIGKIISNISPNSTSNSKYKLLDNINMKSENFITFSLNYSRLLSIFTYLHFCY